MPAHTRSVARPTRWGNLWVPNTGHIMVSGLMRGPGAGFYGGDRIYDYDVPIPGRTLTAEEAVVLYRADLEASLADPEFDDLRAAFEGLRGWNLACWCPLGSPCHRDPLLELANR